MGWQMMAPLMMMLGLGWQAAAPPMSKTEVRAMEDRVGADEDEMAARARLLEHYFEVGDARAWVRHELWLVAHQPGSELHRVPVGLNRPETSDLMGQLSEAWRRAVEDPAAQVDALRNAAVFFEGVDAGFSFELLKRARGVAALDVQVFQLLLDTYLKRWPAEQAALGERALVELEASEDAEMIWAVGRRLEDKVRSARMMARAKELDPEIAEKPERVRRLVVGEGVAAPKVVFQVRPVYPAAALEQGVKGTVRFRVTIGGTGEIRQMSLVSGHPLLLEAAVEALKRWRYEPTVVDGAAMEVVMEVEVMFRQPQ